MTQQHTLSHPVPSAKSNSFVQFILFGLIGVSGIFVDFFVVLICREWFDLDVRVGIFPAFLVAVTWNFELNRRITFRTVGPLLSWWRSYISFVLICLLGLAMRWVLTHVCIEYIGMRDDRFFSFSIDLLDLSHSPLTQSTFRAGAIQLPFVRFSYIAYLLGIALASLFNFFGSKLFAFAPSKR